MLITSTNPFIDWLFPPRCFVCGCDSAKDICLVCLDLCNRNPNPMFCRKTKTSFLYDFNFTVKELIKSCKYKSDLLSFFVLRRLIHEEILSTNLLSEIVMFSPQAITYIPTHIFYKMQRGVDLPLLLAQLIAEKLNVPVVSLLRKNNFFARQALRKLRSDRLAQIRGTFVLRDRRQYDRLLLVDDVVTTGATLQEARKTLKNVCSDIRCLAIAKTP